MQVASMLEIIIDIRKQQDLLNGRPFSQEKRDGLIYSIYLSATIISVVILCVGAIIMTYDYYH
jgi:hypothetical protein